MGLADFCTCILDKKLDKEVLDKNKNKVSLSWTGTLYILACTSLYKRAKLGSAKIEARSNWITHKGNTLSRFAY
jgi:hypothetical protein